MFCLLKPEVSKSSLACFDYCQKFSLEKPAFPFIYFIVSEIFLQSVIYDQQLDFHLWLDVLSLALVLMLQLSECKWAVAGPLDLNGKE